MRDRAASELLSAGAFAHRLHSSPDELSGGFEHVVTGRAARSASAEELSVFLTVVLALAASASPAHPSILDNQPQKH